MNTPQLFDVDFAGNKIRNAVIEAAKFPDLTPGKLVKVASDRTLIDGEANLFGINAADYGAKGDLVYTQPTYETVAATSGTDSTSAIQAALYAAGALVSGDTGKDTEGNAICYIPSGNYKITSTLTVPPNVVLWCEGFLFNFLSDAWTPIVVGSPHSHCKKLQIHANAKTGVRWGIPGSSAPHACNLESIVVWHAGVGYESTKPNNQQKCGLRLHGLDYRLGHIWIKGGNIGLDLSQASDVLAANVFLIGCSLGMSLSSCEQVSLPSVCWDTNIIGNLQIDNSNNISIKGQAFVNSDAYGTPQQFGVQVGKYTGATPNRNVNVEYAAQSTGGDGLYVGKAQDCSFRLNLTNSRTYSQTSGGGTATSHWFPTSTGALLAHDIGTRYFINNGNPVEQLGAAIEYGGELSGYLDIELVKTTAINTSLGTQFGTLLIKAGNSTRLNSLELDASQVTSGSFNIARLPIGTSAETVCAGNDPRLLLKAGGGVRQAVLSGLTDSNGYANFLSAGSGRSVNLLASATPLLLSFADGFGSSGAVDYLAQVEADAVGAWSNLPLNTTSYLYVERDLLTGALSYGYDPFNCFFNKADAISQTYQHDYTDIVPAMTTSTSPSGAVSSSGDFSSTNSAFRAFDDSSTYWMSNYTMPASIQYDFGSPRKIGGYTIKISTNTTAIARAPKSFTFEGWNGSSYTVLDQRSNITWTSNERKIFVLAQNVEYRAYLLRTTSTSEGSSNVFVEIEEIQLFKPTFEYSYNLYLPNQAKLKFYDTTSKTFIDKQRLFLGEVTTGASGIASVISYAVGDAYNSGNFAVTANTNTSKNHNLGTDLIQPTILLSAGYPSVIQATNKSISFTPSTAGTARVICRRAF